jgi:transcriptional regulator with XRE-family HTH domain
MASKKPVPRGRPRKKESPLSRWVDASGLTRDEVAIRFDITRPHLDRLCRGDRRPSLALALKIERITDGAVPVAAWARVPPHSSD